jgi:hypothetical protein
MEVAGIYSGGGGDYGVTRTLQTLIPPNPPVRLWEQPQWGTQLPTNIPAKSGYLAPPSGCQAGAGCTRPEGARQLQDVPGQRVPGSIPIFKFRLEDFPSRSSDSPKLIDKP